MTKSKNWEETPEDNKMMGFDRARKGVPPFWISPPAIPLLVTLRIITGTGRDQGSRSLSELTRLSKELTEGLKEVSNQLGHLRDQVDSLAIVVLQKRRGPDALAVSRGGIRALCQEQCCSTPTTDASSGMAHNAFVSKLPNSLKALLITRFPSPFIGFYLSWPHLLLSPSSFYSFPA